MSENLSWSVFPTDASHTAIPLTDAEKRHVKGLNPGLGIIGGSLSWIVLSFLSGSVFGSARFGLIFGLVVAGGAVVAIHIHLLRKNTSEFERTKAQEVNRRSIAEAQSITARLLNLHTSSLQMYPQLQSRLDDAYSWLPHAEDEYKNNAFASFWDAMEKSSRILGDFHQVSDKLSMAASEYYRLLNGRNHTFPDFPVQIGSIPDPTFTIGELNRIARLGQTNFQFANIWEHRSTREVLIAGFTTLGDAIDNLGYAIETSTERLRESISSDMACVVQAQIETRETLDKRLIAEGKASTTALADLKKGIGKSIDEQSEILDNIQRRRKPDGLGGYTNY